MRRGGRVLVLVGFWVLAWGELSLANVLTGIAVAAALLAAFPAPARPGSRLSIRGSIRLGLYVLRQMVPSNLLVARQVISRRSSVRTGVLAHRLETPSEEVLSLMAHVIALTPGTMTVEVTTDPPVLYAHFLLLDDLEEARRSVAHIERLSVAALGADPS